MKFHATKRRIRQAPMGLTDTDAAIAFGMALHSLKPAYRRRRDAKEVRKAQRARGPFKASPTFNRVVRH